MRSRLQDVGLHRNVGRFEMTHVPYDFALAQVGTLSARVRALGITRFAETCQFVRQLPYGRVRTPAPSTAILDERRGTCSSKHVFLALLARESGRSDVSLILGDFEMSEVNTPGAGRVLARHSLEAVPEVHCFLRVGDERLDFTGLPEGSTSVFEGMTSEELVDPDVLPAEKRRRHAYVSGWAGSRGLDPDDIWTTREECIKELAESGEESGRLSSR